MALTLKGGGSDFTPPPAGLHIAVCAAVIDLGLRDGPYGRKRQIQLIWQFMQNGERFNVSAWYNFTLGSISKPSNLRKTLESWFGKQIEDNVDVDIEKLEGKGCQIQIIHETKGESTRTKVSAVLPLSNGINAPTPEPDDYIAKVIEGAKQNIAAGGNGTDMSVSAQYAKGEFTLQDQAELIASVKHSEELADQNEGLPF